MTESIPHPESTIRICANIKSRKTPDTQCTLLATHGDFCSRHWKHPRRFLPKCTWTLPETLSAHAAAAAAGVIQRVWRSHRGPRRLRTQGPAAFVRSLARNETDLYTLESIDTIPLLYFFSFKDINGAIWAFDIRSLGHLLSLGTLKENPYTRIPFEDATTQAMRTRLTWLRKRKYSVMYPSGNDFSQDQLFKQRVLDLCMKIESFGYHVSCEWFHSMTTQDHQAFYKCLFDLWFHRLGLTIADRDALVPGHMQNGPKKLFRFTPEELRTRPNQTRHWWERTNAVLMEAFLTRSRDKESQRLGALYCLMAFVELNDEAAEAYPWIVASME